MENQKNDNLNLLEAVVQNTEMGKNTLEQILPMTSDVQFKAELLRQRNIYHQLNQEAHTAIEACGGSAQGQSTMAKLNTKMGIGLKTLTDKSTRNLAEMLTQGSGIGVVDCVKAARTTPTPPRAQSALPSGCRILKRITASSWNGFCEYVPPHKNTKSGSPQAARLCYDLNIFRYCEAFTPTAFRGTGPRRSCGQWPPPPAAYPPGR